MKGNPPLNTGVGKYQLSIPILAGLSCYDLIAQVELPLTLFPEDSHTNTLSLFCMLSGLFGDPPPKKSFSIACLNMSGKI